MMANFPLAHWPGTCLFLLSFPFTLHFTFRVLNRWAPRSRGGLHLCIMCASSKELLSRQRPCTEHRDMPHTHEAKGLPILALRGRTVRCARAVHALCARCAKSRPFSTTGRQFFGCRIAAVYYCHCVSL